MSSVVPQFDLASSERAGGMVALSTSPASRALYDVSTSANTRNTIRSARLGPGLAIEVTGPVVVAHEDDLLVGARRFHGVRAVADHQLVLVAVTCGVGRFGDREEQLEPGDGVEVGVRRRRG